MAVAKNKKTGKWYAKLYVKDYAGKSWQKKKEGFATKRDALAWEADFKAQHDGRERLTFKQAYERYLVDCEPRFKKMTLRTKRERFKDYVELYDMAVADITPAIIRQWQNKNLLCLNETGDQMKYSKNTVVSINEQLSAFFQWCCKFCGLSENPVSKAGALVINKFIEKPKRDQNIWKVEDFERFIETIKRDDYHLLFGLLFWLGLRRGEVLGLHFADIDLDRGFLHVHRNITPDGVDTPKTASSERKVSIPKNMIEELKKYMSRFYDPAPDQPLFTIGPGRLTNVFTRKQEEVGMTPCITLHCLRHSHASMLINMGFTPDVIADRLGHKNAEMVLKIYGHMYPEKRIEVVSAIDDMIAGKKRKNVLKN